MWCYSDICWALASLRYYAAELALTCLERLMSWLIISVTNLYKLQEHILNTCHGIEI